MAVVLRAPAEGQNTIKYHGHEFLNCRIKCLNHETELDRIDRFFPRNAKSGMM